MLMRYEDRHVAYTTGIAYLIPTHGFQYSSLIVNDPTTEDISFEIGHCPCNLLSVWIQTILLFVYF